MTDKKDETIERAVALGYDRHQAPAPQLKAKGKGEFAKQIIEIAEKSGVPIVKDKDLVEILDAVEMDAFIPLEAYGVVAEILSYIYSQQE